VSEVNLGCAGITGASLAQTSDAYAGDFRRSEATTHRTVGWPCGLSNSDTKDTAQTPLRRVWDAVGDGRLTSVEGPA